jgi:predicted enzyme related to lactoylglutathione lyase
MSCAGVRHVSTDQGGSHAHPHHHTRGATVQGRPIDTPYGRMAAITEPQETTFAIMGAASSG